MKNIHDILKELGIEIPADKKAEFDAAVNENYKTVAEADKLRTARDTYKAQLDEVSGKLKEFEGVDVNALKGEITKLQNDLAAKDSEYQQKLADMAKKAILNAVKPFSTAFIAISPPATPLNQSL